MKFGEKVRKLRKEKKMSQTELGELCGLSLRTIRNYEVDGRYPKIDDKQTGKVVRESTLPVFYI